MQSIWHISLPLNEQRQGAPISFSRTHCLRSIGERSPGKTDAAVERKSGECWPILKQQALENVRDAARTHLDILFAGSNEMSTAADVGK